MVQSVLLNTVISHPPLPLHRAEQRRAFARSHETRLVGSTETGSVAYVECCPLPSPGRHPPSRKPRRWSWSWSGTSSCSPWHRSRVGASPSAPPPLTSHPAWLLGNLLLEPSHLSFFLGSWISYKTSPPALSLFPTAASLIFFVPLSHSQHSASSSCKRNVPLHSKTSLYSQALPSPPQKKSSDNCVFRLHRGKRFVPLCTQELRFGH